MPATRQRRGRGGGRGEGRRCVGPAGADRGGRLLRVGRPSGPGDRHREGRCPRVAGLDGGQAGRHLLHGRTGGRVRPQHLHQHRGEGAGPLRRVELAGRDLVEQGDRVGVGAERGPALHRGVQRGAEGEDVGGEAGVGAAGHLRRQVGGGAVHQAGRGERRVAERVGDPEVADQRRAVVGDEDVAGLDVAVHDAELVGGGERRGDLPADPRRLGHAQRAALAELLRERDRRQELHDQAGLALVLDDVEDGDGVAVVQPGGDPRLAHRAVGGELGLLGAQPDLRPQLLDRDGALEPLVAGLPHDAHATAADLADEAVAVGQERARLCHPEPLSSTSKGPSVRHRTLPDGCPGGGGQRPAGARPRCCGPSGAPRSRAVR